MSKTVYRDPTPVGAEEQELKDVRVSPLTAKYTKYIREKEMGVDVRESMARGIEAIEVDTNERVRNLKEEVTPEITHDVLNKVGTVNANAEIVSARNSNYFENQPLIGDRLNKLESGIYLNPVAFGAVGDGITDDTIAVQEAIDTAFEKSVGVMITKEHLITQTIILPNKITIIGRGGAIFSSSQEFDLISNKKYEKKTGKIVGDITIGENYVSVDSVADIKIGDLIEIKSGKLWHFDNRNHCYLGEVSVVDRIEGNTVFIKDTLSESYQIKDSISYSIMTPQNINIIDLKLELTLHPTATKTIRKKVLNLENIVDSKIYGNTVKNGQNQGIFINKSYSSFIQNNIVEKSNNYFSGYGIAVFESRNIQLENNKTFGCRRGIEISGMEYPSHDISVNNNMVTGNGYDSEYNQYNFTFGNARGSSNYGIGTHGGAKNVTILSNLICDVSFAVNSRGGNIKILQNIFVGRIQYCILLSYGTNVEVVGNIYRDNSSGAYNNTISDGGANSNTRKPYAFAKVLHSYLKDSGNVQSHTTFESNKSQSFRAFIEISDSADADVIYNAFTGLVVKNNLIDITPQSESNNVHFITNESSGNGVILASGCVIQSNNISAKKFIKYNRFDYRNNSVIDETTTTALYLASGSSAKINIGLSTARVQLSANAAYGNFRVSDSSLALMGIGTPVNVETVRNIDDGTSGKVIFSLNNGELVIKNNLTSTSRMFITIFEEF